jgi:hypothetical protein
VIEQDLRVAPSDGQVLVRGRHVTEEADVERGVERRVDVPERGRERQVRVGLDQTRHDRGSDTVHHPVAGFGRGAAAHPHALDAVTQDDDVSRYGRGTGPIEDLPVDEHNAVHTKKRTFPAVAVATSFPFNGTRRDLRRPAGKT